jgi:hypothetical protein
MSSLIALIDQLARLAVAPLLFGVIATAAILALVRNWRIALPVLIVQYVLVGILLARVIPPGVAFIKLVAGTIVCLALSFAAQRADDARATRGEAIAEQAMRRLNMRSLPSEFLIRAIATVLVLTAAFGATVRFPLPSGARELTLAAYALLACAMLVIGTSPHAVNVGMAVLMLLSGIELAYAPVEPSVTVSVLLALMTMLVGVAVAYLTLADGGALVGPSEESTSMELMPVFDPSASLRNMPADREDRS